MKYYKLYDEKVCELEAWPFDIGDDNETWDHEPWINGEVIQPSRPLPIHYGFSDFVFEKKSNIRELRKIDYFVPMVGSMIISREMKSAFQQLSKNLQFFESILHIGRHEKYCYAVNLTRIYKGLHLGRSDYLHEYKLEIGIHTIPWRSS